MKDKEEALTCLKRMQEERLRQVARREEKDRIIAERWRLKSQDNADRDARREEFERLEEKRESAQLMKDMRFARDEKERWDELRELETEEKENTLTRRKNEWKEFLLKWKVDASKRAVARREDEKRNVQRVKKLRE